MQFIHITESKYLFFQTFTKYRKYFGVVGLLSIINCYFEYRIPILCILLYMGPWVKYIFEHFPTPKIEINRPPKSTVFPEV